MAISVQSASVQVKLVQSCHAGGHHIRDGTDNHNIIMVGNAYFMFHEVSRIKNRQPIGSILM